MNKNQVEAQAQPFKNSVREDWNKFTDDEIAAAKSELERLAREIWELYGGVHMESRRRISSRC